MIPDILEALSVACQRTFFFMLAASVGVTLLLFVQTYRISKEQDVYQKQQDILKSIYSTATSVASDLKLRLFQNYGEAEDDSDAIDSLLQDVLNARTILLSVSETIDNDRSIEDDRRVALNTNLHEILILLFFNQEDDSIRSIDEEARLILAERSVGTFSWNTPVEQRMLVDLARLSFLASVRPKQLRETLTAYASNSKILKHHELNDSLKRVHNLVTSDSEMRARENAETLWREWLASDPESTVDEQVIARASLVYEEYLRILTLQEDSAVLGRDPINANFVGLSQPLELRFLVLIIPVFICIGYFFCWHALKKIEVACALVQADTRWIPSANIFLDNALDFSWYLRCAVIGVTWFLQIMVFMISPAGFGKLALHDVSWVFWTGVILSFLSMVGTAVSARRATKVLSQTWRESQQTLSDQAAGKPLQAE